ncbi:MAG: hypothetical protein ACXW04_05715 [Methylobacter sp.]
MRINNFMPYSKKTPNIINRANAPQSRELELAVQRQIAVAHQIIGNNNIKCTSSQLETVKIPVLANVSVAYRHPFNIRKNGQNAHFSDTLPIHESSR